MSKGTGDTPLGFGGFFLCVEKTGKRGSNGFFLACFFLLSGVGWGPTCAKERRPFKKDGRTIFFVSGQAGVL